MVLLYGEDLKMVETLRAGCIPYCVSPQDGCLYYLMAVDSKYRELCDFGGGRKPKEDVLLASLREFKEETNGIFGNIIYENISDMKKNLAISEEGTFCGVNPNGVSILFVPVESYWLTNANYHFSKKRNHEVSNIIWLHQDTLTCLLMGNGSFQKMYVPKIWKRIRDVLIKNLNDEAKGMLKIVYFLSRERLL